MAAVVHPLGGYSFLPGIAPYSCGVVAHRGNEIVSVTLRAPIPYRTGMQLAADYLAGIGRPRVALCAVALRCPRPYSFAGFAEFNSQYAQILAEWGVFVHGVNPIARTNVALVVSPFAEPMLYGFSFVRPCKEVEPLTFVVAGAGELPEGALARADIVALGDTSEAGMLVKGRFVMDLMEARLNGLGANWGLVTHVNVYTTHSLTPLVENVLLSRMQTASVHGIHWQFSRPPVEGIEYEMDLRGVRTELMI